MKFPCLVCNEERQHLSRGELDVALFHCVDWFEALKKSGHLATRTHFQSIRTAKTVQHRNGKPSVTDGPFAETKEQLGGRLRQSPRRL